MSTDEASKEDGSDASHTDEIIKAVEDCNFIIIDSVGNCRILNGVITAVTSEMNSLLANFVRIHVIDHYMI